MTYFFIIAEREKRTSQKRHAKERQTQQRHLLRRSKRPLRAQKRHIDSHIERIQRHRIRKQCQKPRVHSKRFKGLGIIVK